MTRAIAVVALALAGCAVAPPRAVPATAGPEGACLAEARGLAARGMLPFDDEVACDGAGWGSCLDHCEGGDGEACFQVAAAFVAGENMACAAATREVGCRAGDAASCAWLARQLLAGAGVGEDPARAETLARQACEGGNGVGCLLVGSMTDDLRQRAAWVGRGCELGAASACRLEGWFHLRGEGVARDPAIARQRFEKACRGDDGEGCTMLGRSLLAPAPGSPRPEAAIVAFERACALEAGEGCAQAALCHDGRCGIARPLAGEVEPLLRRGCELGAPVACTYLAGRFYDRGDPSNHPAALALAERACDAEEALGCRLAGRMRWRGEGGAADPARARRLSLRGCQLGSPRACEERLSLADDAGHEPREHLERQCAQAVPRACTALAFVRWHGLGGATDREGALTLVREACEAGSGIDCARFAAFALEAWDDARLVELVEGPAFAGEGLRFVRGIVLAVAGRPLEAERLLLGWAQAQRDPKARLHAQIWVALTRVAQEVPYEPALEEALTGSTEWPAPIARYLLRQRPAADLLDEAGGSGPLAAERRCEAAFSVGYDALVRGRPDEARRWLRAAEVTGVRRFVEWAAAQALLRRLPQP